MNIIESPRREGLREIKSNLLTIDRIVQRLWASENDFAQPIDISSGVYIYGAGELGALAIEYCEACQIPIKGILDQQKTGQITGKTSEYLICKPDEISFEDRSHCSVAVAVATTSFAPICETLKTVGWNRVAPFYSLTREKRAGHPLCNGWIVGSVSEYELATVRWICENWDDTESLAHYEAFLAWHIDSSELPLTDYPVDPNQRYVIVPLMTEFACRHRQMVDVGSHRGESIKRLVDVGVVFSNYVLIEPDPVSRVHLDKTVKNCLTGAQKVEFIDVVLGAHNTVKPFKEGLGYCSQLWSDSTTVRQVVTLDSLGYQPDFLKIHTEGSELDVLLGATNTIQAHKPVLAFSVYHNRDGLCRAIAEAMQRFNGYKWYFRLHSYQGTGAFVYGIPK